METVRDWADAQLAAQGVGRAGPIELHRQRPWSTTWHLQTELGRVWLKECSAGGRYEAGLTALLAQVAPEWTLQPLAVEIDRGWLLLPDGGPDLRSAMSTDRKAVVERWSTLLTEYADLQRRMADFVPHLQAVGVPDLRPDVAAERFRQLVREHAEGELRERLDDVVPSLDRAWERLASSAVPPTVQHDDLHDGSVLCGADGTGAPAFYDWGDATLSHPFASLLVSRRVLAATLDVDADDPAVATVTDAYLRCWGDVAPIETLANELDDVWQLARLSRAWAWARALGDAGPKDWSTWGHPVTAWLQEML